MSDIKTYTINVYVHTIYDITALSHEARPLLQNKNIGEREIKEWRKRQSEAKVVG